MNDDITKALSSLNQGDLVAFEYRQQSGNGRWYKHTCTAVYVARNTDGQVVISYRPVAGTSYINVLGLDKITVLKPYSYSSRRDDAIKLPKRLPGAVDAPVSR
jgi:hypothetical protein